MDCDHTILHYAVSMVRTVTPVLLKCCLGHEWVYSALKLQERIESNETVSARLAHVDAFVELCRNNAPEGEALTDQHVSIPTLMTTALKACRENLTSTHAVLPAPDIRDPSDSWARWVAAMLITAAEHSRVASATSWSALLATKRTESLHAASKNSETITALAKMQTPPVPIRPKPPLGAHGMKHAVWEHLSDPQKANWKHIRNAATYAISRPTAVTDERAVDMIMIRRPNLGLTRELAMTLVKEARKFHEGRPPSKRKRYPY